MSRYINMDDVITYPVMPKKYRKYQTMNLDDAYEQGWDDLQTLIKKMSTADVRENVHGEWIKTTIVESCGTDKSHKTVYRDAQTYGCSRCGNPLTTAQIRTRFCPNCGADMRKVEK